MGPDHDFEIERLELPPGEHLRPYEQTLLDALFGPSSASSQPTIRLSAVRDRFFPAIPRFPAALETAAAPQGLLERARGEVRRRSHGIGVAVIVVALLGGIASLIFLGWVTLAVVLPFITLAVLGLVLMWMAQAMPARTRAGALEAARWRAFRNYLARLP